ncbi:right-handed parallel beta-helix repeat-containing protein [Dokdonella koreensis]|uniref:Parallel beta-helix repeat protein n=1 Tax=Dokdonella koreensis DS-123 TaxID=1300342 RepID=A0A160DVD7_9GAMM|nr:right-handed parallel beta-helix repeat-containing protein [Dokdonella koreensis]ANB18505.1 Parallel beta-helix repeat protein [Dokdonella koreensis DS-123]
MKDFSARKLVLVPLGVLVFAGAAAAQTPVSPPTSWPLTITAPGSYQLTANMLAPAVSSAIVINASNVTLDLNGFVVSQGGLVTPCGPDTATGYGSTCSSSAGPSLIVGNGRNITIKNGIVTNGPASGIEINFSPTNGEVGVVFEDLRVTGNRGAGIITFGNGSRFTNVDVSYNAGDGIRASEATFNDVSVNWNDGNGIIAGGDRGQGTSITVRSNGMYGIFGAGLFDKVVAAGNRDAGLNVAGILRNIKAEFNGWNDVAGLVMDSQFSTVTIVSGCYSQVQAGTLSGAAVPMTSNTCP